MKRGRRLLLTAQCVLNQNSVVHPLARASGALAEVAGAVVASGVGLIQLPCPETTFGGLGRLPATLAEYDTREYRRLCARLTSRVERDLGPQLADGCRVVGVLGIAGSPSCSPEEPRGVWMRGLLARPWLAGVPVLGVPEGDDPEFLERLKRMLQGAPG